MALSPEAAESRTVIKILAGSHVHGLNIATSDQDYEAVVVEPLAEMVKLGESWDETERIGVIGADGARLPDTKYYSLRKWCRMAAKGNPNFILMLFAPLSHTRIRTAVGAQLQDMKDAFLSRQAIKSHLGYMKGQRNRMVNHQTTWTQSFDPNHDPTKQFGGGHGRGKPRFDLIEKYGYDTKFGMHLLRLGIQGVELATTGYVYLPMTEVNRDNLLAVRRGDVPLVSVLRWAEELEERMKAAFDTSPLPEHPDYARIEDWMRETYIRVWAAEQALTDAMASMADLRVQ